MEPCANSRQAAGSCSGESGNCLPAPHDACPHGPCLCFCECPCACQCLLKSTSRCCCVPIEERQIEQDGWDLAVSCVSPLSTGDVTGDWEAKGTGRFQIFPLVEGLEGAGELPILLPQKRRPECGVHPISWTGDEVPGAVPPPQKKRWSESAHQLTAPITWKS